MELVFHASAYKHVPLVEANPLAGLVNNVVSTDKVCRAAVANGVGQVVLISTDKAVRPTNVWGRPSVWLNWWCRPMPLRPPERVYRWCALAMCSVHKGRLYLFRRQIAAGGRSPHPPGDHPLFHDYPRGGHVGAAVSLLAQGGDVFLLDMGEPVRIKALAEQMVRLSGLSLRDATRPDGDIEIVCTGLRPGEKLYEELLIDAESQPTEHPLIYRAEERSIPPQQLWPQLGALEAAIAAQDVEAALKVLAVLVPEWQRGEY